MLLLELASLGERRTIDAVSRSGCRGDCPQRSRGAPDTLGLTATAVLLPTMVSFTFHATNTDACDSTDTSALRSARPVPPIDGRVQSCAAWLQPRLMEVSMLNPRLAQTVAMWVILAAGSVWQGAVVSGSIDDLCGGRTVDARDLPSFVPETSRCAAAGLVIRYGGAGVTIPTQVGDGVAAFASAARSWSKRTSQEFQISTEDVADPTEAAVGSLAATECTSVTWATEAVRSWFELFMASLQRIRHPDWYDYCNSVGGVLSCVRELDGNGGQLWLPRCDPSVCELCRINFRISAEYQ